MKIGELNMHCGECGVIEYCGNSFGYAICTDNRFTEIDTEEYAKIADKANNLNEPKVCGDCVVLLKCNCDECDLNNERQDDIVEQIADFVYGQMLLR